MSGDNGNSGNRRGSVTSAAFSNLFQRSNSVSTGAANAIDQRSRRLSVTTIGLSGTSPSSQGPPNNFNNYRRGSISTNNSDAIDENAVEDEDSARTAPPTTPFGGRRMSLGASQTMRHMRSGPASPPSNGRRPSMASPPSSSWTPSPSFPSSSGATTAAAAKRRMSTSQASSKVPTRTPSDKFFSARSDNGYNWSEQLRSRAESNVAGHRPSFGAMSSTSPTRYNGHHDRTKSVPDLPAPPQQAAAMKPKQPERPKPDAFQERILKGDFYMD